MNWYLSVVKNYVGFSGRASRKEYWMFVLFNIIFFIITIVLDNMLDGTGIIFFIYALVLFLPSLAVTIRRLHDTDRTGWWALLSFIPIGDLVLLVFMCLEGTVGENRFGADPKVHA